MVERFDKRSGSLDSFPCLLFLSVLVHLSRIASRVPSPVRRPRNAIIRLTQSTRVKQNIGFTYQVKGLCVSVCGLPVVEWEWK